MVVFKETFNQISVTAVLDKRYPKDGGLFPVRIRVAHQRVQKYYNTGKELCLPDWERLQQQRIGEGRATMRVRFILNTLNNQDPERECDAFHVFQLVNQAIQDAKNHEPALNERCQLIYFDMPTTSNMLQAYWVDYEVWFRETSAWKYRDWLPRYLVMPPFTNHSDAPQHDTAGHGDHRRPNDRDAITIEPSVGSDDPEETEDET